MNFEEQLDALVAREGGYTDGKTGDSANDSGGETNFGITVAVARAFGYQYAMKDMPVSVARQIYKERYWLQPKFHMVAMCSARVADELFDTGVNCGTATAAKMLQRALNVLNQQGKTFPDMTVDGVIGRMTLAALDAYFRHRGRTGEAVLLAMLNGQQTVRYMEIAEKREKDESFMFGWITNRVVA